MTNQGIISESFQGLLAQACLSALLAIAGVGMSARAYAQARDFVHPGIAESAEAIARARRMIAERREPWYGCFKALEKCWSADPNQRVPEYPTVLESSRCNATIGQAGRRAHDLALMYRLTDDPRYAKKAAEFLNASSHYSELRDVGTGPLDFGKIYLLVAAAELLRFDSNWAKEDKVRFAKMLRDVFYPRIRNGDIARFGNQGLFAYRGALAIAIFLNDSRKYDRIWRYLNGMPHRADQEPFAPGPAITDADPLNVTEFQNDYRLRGRENTIPDYGYDEVLKNYIYANGQCQEASRDQAHSACGLFIYVDIAEMFRMQGDDLYGALDNRILAGIAWLVRFNLGEWQPSGYTDDEGDATFENGLFYRARHRSGRWQSLKPNSWPGPSFGGPGAPRECAYAHYSRVKGADKAQLALLKRAIERENAANGGFETWGAAPNWYYEWAGWGTLMKRDAPASR